MAEEKKRPSVAEMLAAARKLDGGKKEAESETSEASTPAEKVPAKPAAKASAPAAKSSAPGGKMSVADMLAAARSGGAAGAKPAATSGASTPAATSGASTPAATSGASTPAEKKEAPKPAAKPAAKAAKPAGPVVGAGKDTASILAAVRGSAKPGPTSKAEAAPDSKEAKEAAALAKAKLAAMPVMPTKPEYAKPKPAKAPVVQERRNFLVDAFSLATGSMFALGNVALALTGGLSTLGLARYMFPNVLTEPPSRFKVGFKESFSPGTVETKFVAQYGVWVVNTAYQGVQEIYALKTVCTHLGCTPNWLEAEQKFKCPCHGSGFYKDGINFEGPAPRPLERYAIRIADDGQVEIDKSKVFQEEMGQWNDPSSFIPV